jgi:hypothetical protein
LGIDPRFDQTDFSHDPEVLRHRRLAQAELICKLAHEALALEEQLQDLATPWFGDDAHERLHRASMSFWLYNCQGMNMGHARRPTR